MVPSSQRGADCSEGVLPAQGSPHAADSEPEELADTVETRRARVAPAQHGERLDKVLVALAPEFSRSHLQQLVERGHVVVDGAVATVSSRKLKSGQPIELQLVPTEESRAFHPEPMPLAVLHEDEHLLIIDKPAGLVVHPAAGNWSGTLLNGLLAHHAGAAALPRAGIVHRLDKDTSGVMMVGKTLPAVTALVRAIAAREVHRRYLAIATGRAADSSFSISAPIGRDPRQRLRMAVVAGGKPARTDVTVLARRAPHLALGCTLHSGRTHQIRVHLAHQGLPLVGDVLYGGKPALGMARQALHATELKLAHPVSGEPLAFTCAPPPDFAAAWGQVQATIVAEPQR
jgi:23S rRNA pseudouridine1911/1915/1917 synthase